MISFFNGRRRTLGGKTSEVYAELCVDFRRYLHCFKGADLAVFLAVALHANEGGWSWPSWELIGQETGYSRDTVRRSLARLCKLRIEGHRVLLRYQPRKDEGGQFQSNKYLIFPSAEEVKEYEGQGIRHLGHETGGGFDEQPWLQNTTTVDRGGKSPSHRGGKIPPQTNTKGTSTIDEGDEQASVCLDCLELLTQTGYDSETGRILANTAHRFWNGNACRYVGDHDRQCLEAERKGNATNRLGLLRSKIESGALPSPRPGQKKRTGNDGYLCPNCHVRPCVCEASR
jgi:hypothetical protein